MNEITQVYKDRVDELTNLLIKRAGENQLAMFYANESIQNVIESLLEFAEIVHQTTDREKVPDTIVARAEMVTRKWGPILDTVKAQSARYRMRIRAQGLVVD